MNQNSIYSNVKKVDWKNTEYILGTHYSCQWDKGKGHSFITAIYKFSE